MTETIRIADVEFAPGQSGIVRVPVAERLVAGQVELTAHVLHGRKPGPRLFVSAALHGDEINGTEIIRRLLEKKLLRQLSGTIVAVPIVNVYGFVSQQRYLPDRRDLNRSFPGSARGSLAGRVAHTFLKNFVKGCTHGIDLHTGAIHRTNLPQIRARLSTPEVEEMARAFGVPVILNSSFRPGSLRASAADLGIPTLVYEAGEALRFDEVSIRAGVRGVLSVMRYLGMLPRPKNEATHRVSNAVIAHKSVWVRASETGMLNTRLRLGATIEERQILGKINDPFSAYTRTIRSPVSGVLIGRANLPLVNEGDALFHVATFDQLESVIEGLDAFREDTELDPLEDDSKLAAALT
jgi:predicted deacylase